jgi:imidazolonepropionase-like amidohydrolase
MDGPGDTWPGALIVTSPDEVRGAVAAQAAAGFRAVKLYDGLDPQTFAAAVAAAHEREMQVWAHTPDGLSYDDMLTLGVDSIEHLWSAQRSLMDARPDPALPSLARAMFGWDRVDAARMTNLAAKTAEARMWNVPTLTVYTQLSEYAANAEEFFNRAETKYFSPAVVQSWRAGQASLAAMVETSREGRPGRERWVKALYDAGAGLLVGSDTPNPFIVPGYSFHEELDNLSRSGIPTDALLGMATREAARFLEQEGEFGVVAVNARADLILVEGDPLGDLEVLRRPAYVMLNGHLRDRAALQGELDALAARHSRETE